MLELVRQHWLPQVSLGPESCPLCGLCLAHWVAPFFFLLSQPNSRWRRPNWGGQVKCLCSLDSDPGLLTQGQFSFPSYGRARGGGGGGGRQKRRWKRPPVLVGPQGASHRAPARLRPCGRGLRATPRFPGGAAGWGSKVSAAPATWGALASGCCPRSLGPGHLYGALRAATAREEAAPARTHATPSGPANAGKAVGGLLGKCAERGSPTPTGHPVP